MNTAQYIERLNTRFKTGISREHSYRGDLQSLQEAICDDVLVTNEPARVNCGAPDYILTRKNIPVGFIEAKDVGADLKSKNYKEQFDRYRASLPNLIITDYLDFHLYREGELVTTIAIGQIIGGQIKGLPDKYAEFEHLIKDFSTHVAQTIRSSKKLAQMMAGKARLLANVIENALTNDEETENYKLDNANNTLREQLQAFQNILIHDIKPKEFADIYAQTIAYGMFAARLHDPTLDDFSRQEAAELIPKSNPFLRRLFQYIAGYDLDDRLKWIVDALADIFRATDVATLLKDFGKATQQNDPIIHFYETFLGEYDPKLRKARGVWYTPEPVVNFIVRAVDDILKSEFGLKDGLADTSKVKVKVNTDVRDARSKTGYKQVEKEVHRVQILDPATGTGTFLAEVVKQIYQKFEGQQGIWSQYVEEHLIPRLNGFEILMASYAMAHLKLDMLLAETGYVAKKEQRLRVYLTNSLEEHHKDTGTLFAGWLSAEANEANHIKRDTPVMVVLGNPPYSVSSSNKGEWIQSLIKDYKKELNERKINLDDDYIKFIRYGQHFIEKNGEGMLAYISNNSFLDGATHRQMRKCLLDAFDKIYILDLHGNSRKREKTSNGDPDQNVFDIMAGVSINLFIKSGASTKKHAEVNYSDILDTRESKYTHLVESSISSLGWQNIKYKEPYYFFIPKNFEMEDVYKNGASLTEIFNFNNSGFETAKDKLIVKFTRNDIASLQNDFLRLSLEELQSKYKEKPHKINEVKSDVENARPLEVLYRPFDNRHVLISENSQGVMFRPRYDTIKHLLQPNVGLLCCKRQTSFDFQHAYISNQVVERCLVSAQTGEVSYLFPLYLYPEKSGEFELGKEERTPNLNPKFVAKIAEGLGLNFVPEKLDKNGSVCFANDPDVRPEFRTEFAPIDLLDYIYAVLHSPAYREKYKEFLKIDFPRVPYPMDKEKFWQLVELGSQIRQIHLLESPEVERFITTYPQDGNNAVERKMTKTSPGYIETSEGQGQVWINDTQYFDKVPLTAWEFYIGGYQPAQKWLKDRQGRTLSFDDIRHYQKIIVALTETARLMQEVDKVGVE